MSEKSGTKTQPYFHNFNPKSTVMFLFWIHMKPILKLFEKVAEEIIVLAKIICRSLNDTQCLSQLYKEDVNR